MSAETALLLSILVPLLGAVVVLLVGSDNRQLVRQLALATTLVSLGLALLVVGQFQPDGDRQMQRYLENGEATTERFEAAKTAFALTEFAWLPPSSGIDVRLSVGLDGLSVWLYVLSAVLMFSSVLVSWHAIDQRTALFYSMLLLLEAGCLGVFAARDIVLFYIFFEFTLIPLFFLIGIWGSEQRRYAAAKFFLYTLAGSLLTFLGLLTVLLAHHYRSGNEVISCSIPELQLGLTRSPLPVALQMWVFLALFAGFAIKVPLFPLHTWLPLAHVQAPTAGSVFLAGILLKIGTYGFLRFSVPLLPDATAICLPWMMGLAVIGIIYGALVALAQSDMKRLIAYSSVSHLGFCMLGLFALTPLGVQGAALQMVNHGISTGALFALVGMLYERYHTRQIADFGGLARKLPVMAFFMLLFTFASIGVPGLNGFSGEILILIGAFQRAAGPTLGGTGMMLRAASVLAVLGVVLGAWYMLWLVQRVFFGRLKEPAVHQTVWDLDGREIAALLPLAVLVFWIGLYPRFFLDRMAPALSTATAAAEQVIRDETAPTVAAKQASFQEVPRRAY
jgi:NADH-quinone oxidoreductase subunit M